MLERVFRRDLAKLIRPNARYLAFSAADRLQDLWHGIDTATGLSGYVSLDGAGPIGDRSAANPYVPTPYGTLRRLFAALPSDMSRYSFIDFGSGKGRTLIVAAQHGFKEIIGVEFAKILHEQAVRNIAAASVAGRARSVLCDAREFAIPDGPCVLFFFNPFGRPIMDPVACNIALSFAAEPRHIIIALYNETVPGAFDRHAIFRPMTVVRESWLDGLSHNRRYVIRLIETAGDEAEDEMGRLADGATADLPPLSDRRCP